MINKKEKLICIFLITSIITLFLNDRIWKYEYANWITGKYSDLVGLIAWPIFISILIPSIKKPITLLTGILFLLWKTPFVDPFIYVFNDHFALQLTRTIDYTDLCLLSVLPFVHLFIQKMDISKIKDIVKTSNQKWSLNTILVLAFIVFCSTSVQKPAYPKGNVYLNHTFTIGELSKGDILRKLTNQQIQWNMDSVMYTSDGEYLESYYFHIDTVMLYEEKFFDTLTHVHFKIFDSGQKTKIHLINCTIPNGIHLQDWKKLKKETKRRKEHLEHFFTKRMK